MQARARLRSRNLPDGRVRAEREQQLDVAVADVEQDRLDSLRVDGLAVRGLHREAGS